MPSETQSGAKAKTPSMFSPCVYTVASNTRLEPLYSVVYLHDRVFSFKGFTGARRKLAGCIYIQIGHKEVRLVMSNSDSMDRMTRTPSLLFNLTS